MLYTISSFEVNGYNDSDFYEVVYDATTDRADQILVDTTRFAAVHGLPERVPATPEIRAKFLVALAKQAAKAAETTPVAVGDTVKVTNPRARNHKGEVFVVTDFSEYRDRYGRSQTTYVHGEGGIRTSVQNVDKISAGEQGIKNLMDRFKYYPSGAVCLAGLDANGV